MVACVIARLYICGGLPSFHKHQHLNIPFVLACDGWRELVAVPDQRRSLNPDQRVFAANAGDVSLMSAEPMCFAARYFSNLHTNK